MEPTRTRGAEFRIPESYEPVDPFPDFLKGSSFIPHDSLDDRLWVRYCRDRSDGSLKALAWFGPGAEGAPGRIHGGSVSAILDEVLGAAVWILGIPVVTARLLVKYRRPLPVDTVCEIETFITKMDTRRVNVRGTLKTRGGGLIADAEAVFFQFPASEISEKLAKIMAERRAALSAPASRGG